MARLVIKNVNVGKVSPKNFVSKYDTTEDKAIESLEAERRELEAKGWGIVREFNNGFASGIQMSIVFEGIEYHTLIYIR